MSKETRILQVNFGTKHAEYKDKLQAIGERLDEMGFDVRDPKRGGISLAAVIRHLIDNHVRLWETVHNRLEELVKAGEGKVSKADIVNYAILSFSFEDVQAQVNLEDAERAMHDYEAEFEDDE
jgi:hypothetical protein